MNIASVAFLISYGLQEWTPYQRFATNTKIVTPISYLLSHWFLTLEYLLSCISCPQWFVSKDTRRPPGGMTLPPKSCQVNDLHRQQQLII